MVSYAKARAEGLGLECKTGLLARPERVVILAIGLLSGTTIWALALLAIFSHITAIERIAYIWRVTRQSVDAPLGATRMEVGPDVLTENADSSTNNRHSPTVTGTNEAIDPSIRPVPTSVPPFTGSVHQE
jgi:CDP-diacylglycerol--glycerol-3-phosphate 3-phosphatidyltransferase